nr:MAG TPA: hypothetical protein [Caudoviricetes sp.]
MLTREQFQSIIGKYATADDEATLKDVSDLMGMYDEMSNPQLQQERDEYKEKYENVVKEYKDRFLSPKSEDPKLPEDEPDEDESPEKFDDLFS